MHRTNWFWMDHQTHAVRELPFVRLGINLPTDIASLCIKIYIVLKWSSIEVAFGIDISVTFMLTLVWKDFKRLNNEEESIKRYQCLVYKDSVNLCKTLVFEDSINLCKSLVYETGHENRLIPRRTNGSSRALIEDRTYNISSDRHWLHR
jgi:hypothetical protein